jgi:hypothetical protein
MWKQIKEQIHIFVCACLMPESRFTTSYVVVSFIVYNWVQLRWEVIVCFVDIGRIVGHHCLNFFS